MQEENKVYNIQDYFEEHRYLDAKDTSSEWRMAQVVSLNREKNRITVHYDGWSNKHNEEFSMRSYKIAPFRTFTNGYTG